LTRAVLSPLVSGTTYRRGVYLLLGGVIALPYVLLAVTFASMLANRQVPRPAVFLLIAVAVLIGLVPPFLDGTRALQIVAARTLLGADLPDPPPAGARDLETRARSALWFAVHAIVGGAVWLVLFTALPMALLFIGQQAGIPIGGLDGARVGPVTLRASPGLSLAGLAMLVATGYAVAGLGALARLMAPALLGPSAAERIAALEARTGELAERNRLARELHDSIGHSLTVTTLQAAAAREVFDTDPAFVRSALAAIEETGRAAMADLDHVLGLLREPDGTRRAPQRTLADLDRLVADARATGQAVTVDLDGSVAAVPAAVSREGYRIVQEGLTNAVRHAGRRPVTLRVAVADRSLDIEVSNPLAERSAAAGTGGRGLAGIRERVALLGGQMSAGPDGTVWRVAVRLPTGGLE
jgi:signal transduction histidine kinase